MHALREGQTVSISDPRNHFPLDRSASHHLLLASGIGVTPILCMAEQLAANGASFGDRLRSSRFAKRVRFHFDDGEPAQKLDLDTALRDAPQETHLYVCGPTGFMERVLGSARSAGWPEAQLHREHFAAATVDTGEDTSFEVQIASTGTVIRVAADQTVLQALAAHGVHVETSCESGVCGACLTRVLQGAPEHRDLFLTPEEQQRGDRFTPCCSRSRSSRLVLDL